MKKTNKKRKIRAARRIRCFCADLHNGYLREYMKKNALSSPLGRAKKAVKQIIGQ